VCSGSIAYILTGFYDFDNVNVQQALCLSSYKKSNIETCMTKTLHSLMRLLACQIIMLALLGCQPATEMPSSPTGTLTPASGISSQTAVTALPLTTTPSATEIPASISADPSPTMTSTPTTTYPFPAGVMARDVLQARALEWVNGNIQFTDEDRILDEITGAVLPLGLFSNGPLNEMDFTFYNLGFTILNDENANPYLVVIAGFENSAGQRFTFPFHVGELNSRFAIVNLGQWEGRRINQEKKLFFGKVTPFELAGKADELVNFVNGGSTWIGSPGMSEKEEENYPVQYLMASETTTQDLVTFLECETCLIVDIPDSTRKYINVIPEKFEDTIPYMGVLHVNYW
jgi:hypothetical protein